MESKIYVKKGSSAKNDNQDNDRPQTKPKMKVFSGESNRDRDRNRDNRDNRDNYKDNYKPAQRNTKIEPHIHLLQKFSNYNWDGLDINDLYSDFKEIEKNLKSLLEVKFRYILL